MLPLPGRALTLCRLLAAVAVLVGAEPVVRAGPAAASSWSVTLTASATDVDVGQSVTLTATVNQDLTLTGYFVDIYDQTTGTPLHWCQAGTTCRTSRSEASAGSHTYIAYVNSDPFVHYPPCCVQAASNAVTVNWHARATAALDVAFSVAGTLPVFPCVGCSATFSGSGSGAGNGHAEANGAQYNVAFTFRDASAWGTADYAEVQAPLCPVIGSAAGAVSLSGAATGAVVRSDDPSAVGAVTAVAFTLQYTYQRGGPAAAVIATSGTARIYFTVPGRGPDYVFLDVVGAGAGLFAVDPLHAAMLCAAPGPLPFTVVGDIGLRWD